LIIDSAYPCANATTASPCCAEFPDLQQRQELSFPACHPDACTFGQPRTDEIERAQRSINDAENIGQNGEPDDESGISDDESGISDDESGISCENAFVDDGAANQRVRDVNALVAK
jgi:hypothetical protein